MTVFETVMATASVIGVFAIGWTAGTAYTWRNVRRTMIETVAMGRVKNPKRRA